jgi:DNA-binding MarR family transcriptional regulator
MTDINVMPVNVRRVRRVVMITPEELGERYLAVHHRMFRAVNDEMSGCGLSMARTKVLARLKEHGPTRQNVLATHFGMAPHSITDIVDALERQGLAQRRPDATDRRAKLVAITAAGETCLGVAHATRQRLLTQIFGALSEADRVTLTRLLGSLDEAAQHVIDRPTPSPAAALVTAPAGAAPVPA